MLLASCRPSSASASVWRRPTHGAGGHSVPLEASRRSPIGVRRCIGVKVSPRG
jgi:hypothetical protein